MRPGRAALGLAATAFLVLNVVYWQDPWLYRSTARMLASGSPTAEEALLPDEEIRGDGSYVLPVAPADARSIAAAALERMRAYAESFGSHALIVVHRGAIQYEWYAPHWERSRLTQSQSMHKSLMGLFVGIAIADGRIASVDEPVGRWITEWTGDPRGAITLRQLLTMSSGLAQYRFTLNPFSDDLRWLNSGRSIEALLRTPSAGWAPGTRYDYNNVASELLGVVLERAYGRRYPELLREKLWLPMGGGSCRARGSTRWSGPRRPRRATGTRSGSATTILCCRPRGRARRAPSPPSRSSRATPTCSGAAGSSTSSSRPPGNSSS
jgi:CubicO group peptidase (beta-lactamase class C family)